MKTKNILIYTGLLLGGLLFGYLIFGGTSEPQTLGEHISETHTDEEGNVVYTCSMHPQVRESEPGNCPICGMDLIPADDLNSDKSESPGPHAIQFSKAALALAEIETTPVRTGTPVLETRLPGKVAENQNLVSNVTAHFPGRVRELYVDYTGDYVRKGQKLASIYSPELITAQRELLETARFKEQNPRLYESARRKLMLWEFPEATIDQIERSGEVMEELDFFSPVSGYVSQIDISREDHINEGSMLYRIADLSQVWIEFEAYESSVSNLNKGDKVEFTVSSVPGQTYTGTVNFIQPFLSERSRTVEVRITANNPQNRMKPGMFAEGIISSQTDDGQQILIPRSAVLWTGSRSIVFVDVSIGETPAFEAREVILGKKAGNEYIIESGLEPGESVVTNGTFKVDAAAQLSDKLSMMNPQPGSGVNLGAHDHGDMDMDIESAERKESSGATNVDHSGHQMQNDLEELIPEYLKLREALANDDFGSAKEHIKMFSMDSFSGIEELRAEFKAISETLISRIEDEGYEGTLFKQYCPMYDGGSSWISDKEDIENPFYGSQMHNCGETVEEMNTEQSNSNE
ncbi:efflux RND transporter periplasmic adaptor subunit [Gracilimonas amylolytica]|uniref:efflux RND transporter periplasmic adaptor subunit n=1 Tax=Gracilimonas amylolytica TaxID=1749045 RepID=UPI000CD7FDA8|nr:efflux RND transporter periplasmic adaptor subunit [Gracilimonas amylolytica]